MTRSAANVAFESPDLQARNGHSASRPVDLVHLAHQTMGDKDLEIELLALFARQARAALTEMAAATPETMPAIAHRIKGAAGAVGAFGLAATAADIESGRTDASVLAQFGARVIEAENFINTLCR